MPITNVTEGGHRLEDPILALEGTPDEIVGWQDPNANFMDVVAGHLVLRTAPAQHHDKPATLLTLGSLPSGTPEVGRMTILNSKTTHWDRIFENVEPDLVEWQAKYNRTRYLPPGFDMRQVRLIEKGDYFVDPELGTSHLLEVTEEPEIVVGGDGVTRIRFEHVNSELLDWLEEHGRKPAARAWTMEELDIEWGAIQDDDREFPFEVEAFFSLDERLAIKKA